jgi:hypothetical protein
MAMFFEPQDFSSSLDSKEATQGQLHFVLFILLRQHPDLGIERCLLSSRRSVSLIEPMFHLLKHFPKLTRPCFNVSDGFCLPGLFATKR